MDTLRDRADETAGAITFLVNWNDEDEMMEFKRELREEIYWEAQDCL